METGPESNIESSPAQYMEKRSILSIVFFPHSVHLIESRWSDGTRLRQESIRQNQAAITPEDFPELERFLSSDHLVEKATATWAGSEFCLVPSPLYDPGEKDSYRIKNGTREQTALSKSSYLDAIDSHLIYGFPHQLDKFLLNKYPGINLLSDVEVAIRYLMKNSGQTVALSVFCENRLLLLLKKHGRLAFCNAFTVSTTEDMLYYISYVLQRNKCYSTTTPVMVRGQLPDFMDRELAGRYLGELMWPEDSEDRDFLLHQALLCVS